MNKIILASGSPRRREIMELVGLEFDVINPDVDESIAGDMEPPEVVKTLSQRKAGAVSAQYPDRIVIGADTIVEIDGRILGKPGNRQEAVDMLSLLSGRQHRVYTGVSVFYGESHESFVCRTLVNFAPLSREIIESYVDTGEPMDKAGAYGIQGRGAVLVETIEGDYFNVMGLPISSLYFKIKNYLNNE